MTQQVSKLLKPRANMACFRACLGPGLAKDLSAARYFRKRQATIDSMVHAHCRLDN